MYSISYNISYMQCSAIFLFTALETLLNRDHESEWLIHKWDPDSVVGTQTPPAAPLKKKQTFLLSAFKNTDLSLSGFMILLLQKTQVEGVRGMDSLRTRKLLVHTEQGSPSLPHGGDHAGRMVRSKGEAGGRVHGRRCGQHVAGVAERGDVTQRRHVPGEGSRVEGAALGEVLQRVVHLFTFFGFARHLPVSGLDAFLLHRQGSVNLNKDEFFFFFFTFLLPSKWSRLFAHRACHLPQASNVFRCWLPLPQPCCAFLFFFFFKFQRPRYCRSQGTELLTQLPQPSKLRDSKHNATKLINIQLGKLASSGPI